MIPLVSVVMPCRGRREFSAIAFASFLSQTYANKELVILDDEDDRAFPNGVDHPLVRYFIEPHRLNIPKKRNKLNRLSNGSIICHQDSDDWSHPDRVSIQVAALESSGKAMTGFNTLLFIDEEKNKAYKWHVGSGTYVCGTSFCYTKSWTETHQFPENKDTCSDNSFCRDANKERQLHSIEGEGLIVARYHSGNTEKNKQPKRWRPILGIKSIPAGFFSGREIPQIA